MITCSSSSKKVKVKWSRYRPGVAQRVGRGIALLFHDRGTRRGLVVSGTSRPHFTPAKDPVPILQEAGWTGGRTRPHRNSIPDRQARSSVAIPTELPGPRSSSSSAWNWHYVRRCNLCLWERWWLDPTIWGPWNGRSSWTADTFASNIRSQLKCGGARAKTRFRLSAKRTVPFKSAGRRQFSRLLAAEVCVSTAVMLDTPYSEVVWRVLATLSIRLFPLHFPSRASPCAITFKLDSTT